MLASPDDLAPTGNPDPSPRIEAVFTRIAATSMQGLPYLNPRLAVSAVGFRPWQASWVGVLVTPWGINLLQLPAPGAPFAPWRADETIDIALPGGTVPFMPARLDALGDYRLCSLFSPAQQFADQDSAIATAHEVLRLLFAPDTVAAGVPQTSGDMPSTAARAHVRTDAGAPDLGRRRLFGLRP